MSTHPGYDPDPQADGPAIASSVRKLIDNVIVTAAPRLGKTAVARIALPLTDAVIALRSEMREDARRVDALEGYVTKLARGLGVIVTPGALDTTESLQLIGEAALAMLDSRQHIDPPQLGEIVRSNERLAEVARVDGVVIVAKTAGLLVSERGDWYLPGSSAVAHPDLSAHWVVERVPGSTPEQTS